MWICLRLFWKKKKKSLRSRVMQQLLLLLLILLNILRSNAILAFLSMKFIHWNNSQSSEAFVIKFEMLAKCQSTFGKLPKDIFWRTLRIHVYFYFFPFSKVLTEYRQTIASFELELLFYVNKRQTVADTRHIQAAFVGISCVVINNSGYYFGADGSYSSTYITRKIDK